MAKGKNSAYCTSSDANCMQYYTKATCASQASSTVKTLIDARDGNTYDVRYISGNCWMVQNLRYVGDTGSSSETMIMKSATSNISADKNISYTDLTAGNTFTAARTHDSGDTVRGVYYNYAAASAMTITGSSNMSDQTQDICPKGWKLPNDMIISFKDEFEPVSGGYYDGGSNVWTSYGMWWFSGYAGSGTAGQNRADMSYNGSVLFNNSHPRSFGLPVRCFRTS